MPDSSSSNPAGSVQQGNPDEIWVTCLTDTCLDDVTLPPGGVSTHPTQRLPEDCLQAIPRPDYLSHEGRDLRLDLIRGYFVFAMIIDHVRGESPLYLLTGGNRFFTSAAEGFILISGLVTGLVYRRIIKREGMSAGLLKVLRRALTLYLLTVGVTLVFSLFSEITYMPWATGVDFSDPLGYVVSVFSLHQTYYLIDVMLLYTVLFLITPLAFILLDRGKAWILLGGSWLLYLLYQFYPNYVTLPWPIAGNYLFSFSGWQVLFFSALALGYLQDRLPALGQRATRTALVATGVGTALLIILFFIIDTPTSLMPHGINASSPIDQDVRLWIDENIFSKADIRPGRLVASAVTYSFLFFLVTYFWRAIKKAAGWLLLPIGQSALYAYTAHIAIASLVALALKPFDLPGADHQLLNAALQLGSILMIWYVVRKQFIKPTEGTQRFWNTSPVVMGLLIAVVLWRFPLPAHPGLITEVPVDPSALKPINRYGTPAPKGSETMPIQRATPTPDNSSTHPVMVGGSDLLSSPYLDKMEGSVHERWFYSPALDRDMPYYIYLPPDYDQAGRRYPVMFMLHGMGGHREEWLVYGLINVIDREITNNNIPPVIAILPQGDKEFWVNHADSGPPWGDYIDQDLVAHVDATYRTLRSPASRAIGGLSMGGFGALYHGFTHPEIFGVVGAHSASLRPDDGTLSFLGRGEEYNQVDPVELAKTAPNLARLQIWIDVGQEDSTWQPRNTLLHQALSDHGIDHIWQIMAGGHDYTYWTDHMLDYVSFYGHALATK